MRLRRKARGSAGHAGRRAIGGRQAVDVREVKASTGSGSWADELSQMGQPLGVDDLVAT